MKNGMGSESRGPSSETETDTSGVVIATAMSVAGPLRLFSNANFIVHPHYESAPLRNRVRKLDLLISI